MEIKHQKPSPGFSTCVDLSSEIPSDRRKQNSMKVSFVYENTIQGMEYQRNCKVFKQFLFYQIRIFQSIFYFPTAFFSTFAMVFFGIESNPLKLLFDIFCSDYRLFEYIKSVVGFWLVRDHNCLFIIKLRTTCLFKVSHWTA